MKRLGFLGKIQQHSFLPEEMIKKEGELQRELGALLNEKQRYTQQGGSAEGHAPKRMEAKEKKKSH